MKESFEAIYENGVLRPLSKLSVPEGQKIRLTLEAEKSRTSPSPGDGEARYDFSDLVGKLSWRRDAVEEQRRIRNEWASLNAG